MTSAFLLTSDDVLQLDQGHWLRNLTVEPPDRRRRSRCSWPAPRCRPSQPRRLRTSTAPEPHYYRVDRMLDGSIGDIDLDPPVGNEIPDWFDLSEYARTVRVQLRAASLESLPAPHQLGDPTDCGEGIVELDITVNGGRRLEHLLVSLPADAMVVDPSEYAELGRTYAARLAAAYG